MNGRFFILLIILLVSTNIIQAQPETLWVRTFGGPQEEKNYAVEQTDDGGFILVGYTESYGAGGADVWVIKTDSSGNEEWCQTYGGLYDDCGNCIRQTSDGGYIICGYTEINPYGFRDVCLIKTDELGNEVWAQTYGGNQTDEGRCVRQLSDGGYVISGDTYSYGAGYSDAYLIRTDASGNELWSHTYGGSLVEDGRCVYTTDDAGYIIAGHTNSFGAGFDDFYLVKADSLGNEQWSYTYGGSSTDQCYDFVPTSDGGYALIGSTLSFGIGLQNFLLIKVDAVGSMLWLQAYAGSNIPAYGKSVQETSDGGLMLTGYGNLFGVPGSDYYVIKTDGEGHEEWSQTYGGYGSDYGMCGRQLTDGGYIMSGFTSSAGAGGYDMMLIRLAPETAQAIQIELTYLSGSPIPASGGALYYDLYIENAGMTAVDYDAWLEIAYEGGLPATVVQRHFNDYGSGWTINRPGMMFPVNAGYAAGNYTFTGKAGYVPDVVWDESGFPFVKEGTDFVAGFVPFPVDGAPNPFEDIKRGPSSHNPAEFVLLRAYPNPFNPKTVITYQLPFASHVNLRVYDTAGRLVTEMVNGRREAGVHEVTFDAAGLPSGVYIYCLQSADYTATGKMILLK